MNKLTKGLIAAAAGTALLMGGAGTLATWSGTQNVSFSTPISAGSLSLSAPTGGVWKDQKGTTLDLASFKVVPGDTLTYTTTANLTATGDNLQGNIALGAAAISPATAAAADTSLAALLTKSATFTVNGAAGSTFTAKTGTQPIVVTVSIQWPSGTSAADNAAMNGKVNLGTLPLTVTQS